MLCWPAREEPPPTLLNFLLGRKQILDAWQNTIKLRHGICVDILLEDLLILVLLGGGSRVLQIQEQGMDASIGSDASPLIFGVTELRHTHGPTLQLFGRVLPYLLIRQAVPLGFP